MSLRDRGAEDYEANFEDKYQLGDALGRGGFGTVYKGLNVESGDFVAIKQVSLTGIPKEQLSSIMMEIDLLKKLNHVNIVKYLGFYQTKEYLHIILEFVEGGSLESVLKKFGNFRESLVGIYIVQVLDGLVYLHEQGVIHRDIKAANILITKEGRVKVADFGVSTKLGANATVDNASNVVGSPYWMAPEIIELSGATTESDIWSVGCTVIELLTGAPPYFDLAAMPALFHIVEDPCPPLPEGISNALRDFLMQCFQKDPNLRISAKQLLKHRWIRSCKDRMEQQRRGDRPQANPIPLLPKPPEQKPATATNTVSSLEALLENAELKFTTNNSLLKLRNKESTTETNEKDPFDDFGDDDLEGWANNKSDANAEEESGSGIKRRARRQTSPPQPVSLEHGPISPRAPLSAKEKHSKDDKRGRKKKRESKDEEKSRARSKSRGKTRSEFRKKGRSLKRAGSKDRLKDKLKSSTSSSSSKDKIAKKKEPKTPRSRDKDKSNKVSKSSKKEKEKEKDRKKKDKKKSKSSKKHDHVPLAAKVSRVIDPGELLRGGVVAEPVLNTKIETYVEESDDTNWDEFFVKKADTNGGNSSTPTVAKATSHVKEGDNDDEDWDLEFGDDFAASGPSDQLRLNLGALNKGKKEEDEEEEDGFGADFGEETDRRGDTLGVDLVAKLRSKMSERADKPDTFDDDEDPFADGFDDDDDSDLDLEEAQKKDELTRVSADILKLMSQLQHDQEEAIILDACNKLIDIFKNNPAQKGHLIRHHGVIPIIEMIEVSNLRVLHAILRVVNQIIHNNVEMKENLCMVGGIPSIIKFAGATYAKPIRRETALFVKQMVSTSQLTLQMFVACRGLPVLVDYLHSPFENNRPLVWMAIDAVNKVFELQNASLPRNDFCRLFTKSGLLTPLANALMHVVNDEGEGWDPEDQVLLGEIFQEGEASSPALQDTKERIKKVSADYASKICDTMLLFSSADKVVKAAMASMSSFLVQLLDDLPQALLLKMLRVFRTLTMDSSTLKDISRAGAISKLVALLDSTSYDSDAASDQHKQILPCLFNLCRIDRVRQTQAAKAGLIPHLQYFIRSNNPLKQFALPIICQMAHCKAARQEMWQHQTVEFYIDLIRQEIKTTWPATVMESLAAWMASESPSDKKVEDILVQHADKFVQGFAQAQSVSFVGMLEPLHKILNKSTKFSRALASMPAFVESLLDKPKLKHPDALVRVNALKILSILFKFHQNRREMLQAYNLRQVITDLRTNERSVLVLEIAAKLLARFQEYE
ncbi:Protein kinase of the Mitotic Exit Network [Balamuthia mandrillaris]